MKTKIISILLLSLLMSGCSEDFLETRSTQDIDESLVFTDTKNAMLAINGLHKLMWTQDLSGTAPRGGFEMIMIWMDMLGEDLVYTYSNAQYQSEAKWVTHRNYSGSGHLLHFFRLLYYFVSNANMVMDNIDNATGPDNEKSNIKGQALFYRAFGYFYLVQLWAERYHEGGNNTQLGVVMRSDGDMGHKARSTVEEVYAKVNDDLDEAIRLLAETTVERPNKSHIHVHIARGLKARVLLAQSRWAEAADMAKLVVDQSGAKLQDDTYITTQDRFSDASNTEWLWGSNKVAEQIATLRSFHEYMSNNFRSYNGNTPRAIYNLLYDKISPTDVRKGVWFPRAADKSTWATARPQYSIGGNARVANYMANKYLLADPNATFGNVPFMRLPEMMLIQAEGYARAGENSKAAQALYPLAKRRDPAYTLSTKTGQALIDEIMVQRRVELWGEGFRFLDLKRLNMPLDRGPAPRDGYNKGWWPTIAGSGTATFVLTNWDPEASNFNMYGDGTVIGEAARYREAGHVEWQFKFHQDVIDSNPLCEQNP
ncbi:MAG: RagB/SusD family nutrient uptake outer membrane protein [Mediterranea sp.]|jgi:hypothetical protein|nr:RagB/SusD family nutrient uptake outer membrane protein [Mediterranea sp.]